MPIEYLFILIVATLLECFVAYLAGFRTLRYQQAIFLVNLLTVPPISYLTWIELINSLQTYTIATVIMVALEISLLMYVLRTKKLRFILTIILMNVVTYGASLLYALA